MVVLERSKNDSYADIVDHLLLSSIDSIVYCKSVGGAAVGQLLLGDVAVDLVELTFLHLFQ